VAAQEELEHDAQSLHEAPSSFARMRCSSRGLLLGGTSLDAPARIETRSAIGQGMD
jgi:hypothetical protein